MMYRKTGVEMIEMNNNTTNIGNRAGKNTMLRTYRYAGNFFAAVISAVLLSACVTETVETTPRMKFADAAIISVQDPYNKILKGSTIAWLPDAVLFYEDDRMNNAPVRKLIESEIIKNIKAKQLQMVESVNGSRYAIAYTAALESSLDDEDIIRRFGLLPGHAQIPSDDGNVEKGTLIIYIFDNRSNDVVWRTAAQVGVQFNASMEDRKQRIEKVLAEMFQSLDITE